MVFSSWLGTTASNKTLVMAPCSLVRLVRQVNSFGSVVHGGKEESKRVKAIKLFPGNPSLQNVNNVHTLEIDLDI